MKITKLDIKGFGKFGEKTIHPGEGFNLIFEPNESGKSTLQAFIKAMFYGQRGGRKAKDGSLPPAKHYKPWKGAQYAGVLEYRLDDGSFFRIGRNFDKGSANIYDGVSNNLTSSFPQDKETGPKFAEEQLGLDEAAFERSVFIRQMQCALDEEGKRNLVERLSNLNTTGSEDLSLTRAVNALDTALLERVGTGRSTIRPLDKINLRLSELEQKKQALEALNERFLETVRDLHEKKGQLLELTALLAEKETQRKLLRKQRLEGIKRELKALKDECAALDESLGQCEAILSRLSACGAVREDDGIRATVLMHELRQIRESVQSEESRISDLKSRQEALLKPLEPEEEFLRRVQTVEEKLKNYNPGNHSARRAAKPIKPGLVLLGLFSAALLVTYFMTSSVVFLGLAFVFGILAGVFITPSGKKTGGDNSQLEQALAHAGFSDMAGFIQYKDSQLKNRGLLEQNSQRINEAESHLSELLKRSGSCEEQLSALIGKNPGTDRSRGLEAEVAVLKKGIEDFKRAREDKQLLAARKTGIENQYALKIMEAANLSGKAISSLDDLERAMSEYVVFDETKSPQASGIMAGATEAAEATEATEAQLSSGIEALKEQIKSSLLEIATLNTRLEQAPKEGELSSLLEELQRMQEKKAELEETGASLNLAIQILNETALKLQRDYIPELNKEMGSMMRTLTSGRYQSVRTNDGLQVNLEVPESEELIPASRLSGGTIDQVYFSMRLAAVRLLERGRETLPLFMDEPFSQYDEDRVRRAFELLKAVSGERQIFFFTCREREFELAQSVFGDSMNRISL